jgi:aminoglycoside phosphotransferase (APT) family kinase protein
VDATILRELFEEQFPRLAPALLEPLGEGWDNLAFLVGGEWVFRFPRRAQAAPLIETELRVLPRLAPALPLPIPVPELRGRPGPRFPWPFAGHRRIPGVTADRAGLTASQRADLAVPLAGFLRALHALVPAGVEGDAIGRLEARRLRSEIHARLPSPPAFVDEPVRAPRADALVHGDLHARQLLVDGGRLSGVIDWGDVHFGDRAVDLAIAHAFLPPEARAVFRAAYGPAADDETWRLARLRALHVSAALLTWARQRGDAPLVREAMEAIARA